MQIARSRITALVALSFVAVLPAFAQSVDSEQREAAWRSYKLPSVEFARFVDAEKSVLFRAPASWQMGGYLKFKGPQDSELHVFVEKFPDGMPLRSYTNAVLQNLRNLPGGADSLAVRRTEISGLEAREFLFNLADVRGQMTRRMIWSTVSGPRAFSFIFIAPETAAAELEPYFKAVIESAVIFESEAHYTLFDKLRSAAIKESKPARIDEVRALVSVIDGFDAEARSKAVTTLASVFAAAPDSVLDLLIDRRPIVRGAAVEALGRGSARELDGFLLQALADPSAAVAVRAARALAKRVDVVKLLRDDSAGWSGLQTERVIRAMAIMDERARNQIVEELTKENESNRKSRKAVPPPPPPPAARSKSSATKPNKGTPKGRIEVEAVPVFVPKEGSAAADAIHFLSVANYNDEFVTLGMFPDLDALAPALSATTLLESGERAARLALTLALEARTKLPADQLIKLLSSSDGELARLAAKNLAISGSGSDIARIETLAKGVFTVSGLKPGDTGYRRPLPEELAASIKKIRWREELVQTAGQATRDELFKRALADDELAPFAWPYMRDYVEAGGPKYSKPLVAVQPSSPAAAEPHRAATVLRLAENAFPPAVTFYAVVPDAQGLIDKLGDSLTNIQLDSARNQANLLLMIKGIGAQLAKSLDARADLDVLQSAGIKPHAPIAVARWTADGAPRGLAGAQRTATIVRVTDRDRFENFIATYQRQLGRFGSFPEILSIGARIFPLIPTAVPLAASAVTDPAERPFSPTTNKYTLIASNNCLGYPVTVIERREFGFGEPLHRDTVFLAYVGDAAVLASDWFSLRDCLLRIGGKGETLATNAEFKRAVDAGGDVIYMSDLLALFQQSAAGKTIRIAEQGALKISRSAWESSFDLAFKAPEWLKPLPFKTAALKASSALLPQSSIAYLFAKVDIAQAWRSFGRAMMGSENAKQLESIWEIDFEREVMPELGPECGIVLLGLPSLAGIGASPPWAVFIETKSDRLATAFAQGKLIKGVSQPSKAVKVKVGSSDYWIAVKNGFLVVAGSEVAIDKLDAKEHLSQARDFEQAAKSAPNEVIAFGGANIEAAAATLKADPGDPVKSQAIATIAALARAFHSLNLYATMTGEGIKARLAVSLDREGRYSVSDLASLSKDYQFAAAEVEARGVPIADQKRIAALTVRITSKAPGAIDRLKSDVSSPTQTTDKRSDNELVVTIRPRRPDASKKAELPVTRPELADYLKPTAEIRSRDETVVKQAREIAGTDRDAWSVARKLADWTYKNIKWKSVDKADAAQTLATREADCLEFSQLYVAMARSLGLPARIVTGLAHGGTSFGGHAWTEVWAGDWVELDPTWGTNFVDATHIRSTAFELETYAALNLIGIEVLDAKHSAAEFQKDGVKLVEALADATDEDALEHALGVAVEPAILANAAMGEGAWASLSPSEREQVYSAQRRVVRELHSVFDRPHEGASGARVLKVTEEGDHAEALLLSAEAGGLVKLRIVRKGGAWFVEEARYEDLAYNVISETLRSIAVVLEAKRSKKSLPALVSSAHTRILLARQEDPAIAIQIANEALKETPGNAPLLYLKALCLIASTKKVADTVQTDEAARQEGVNILTELSDLRPAFPPAVRELGEFYAGVRDGDPEIEKKRDKAIEALQRYAVLVPEDPRPHENLAKIYDARKDPARAEAGFRAVIERDPKSADGYSELARFLVRQGRHKDALDTIDRSREDAAGKDEMFAQLFFAIGENEDQVARIEALASAAPERLARSFRANLNLAYVRINNEQPAQALPLLKAAAELDRKSDEPHNSMAEAYRKLRNWAAALKSADTAIQLDPDNGDNYFQKACALAQLRRSAESIAALKKAIELDEDIGFAEELETEPDLKPLTALPAFKKLVEELKQKK